MASRKIQMKRSNPSPIIHHPIITAPFIQPIYTLMSACGVFNCFYKDVFLMMISFRSWYVFTVLQLSSSILMFVISSMAPSQVAAFVASSRSTQVFVQSERISTTLSSPMCLHPVSTFKTKNRQSRHGDVSVRLSPQDDDDFLSQRIAKADWLEVRLDATLCVTFALARFLIFDMTLPRKVVPGFEIVDVVAVLDTLSSAGALAILWILAGLLTGLFQDTSNYSRLIATSVISGPLWILLERAFQWPISAGSDGFVLLQIMGICTIGVFGTMFIGRSISRFLP